MLLRSPVISAAAMPPAGPGRAANTRRATAWRQRAQVVCQDAIKALAEGPAGLAFCASLRSTGVTLLTAYPTAPMRWK